MPTVIFLSLFCIGLFLLYLVLTGIRIIPQNHVAIVERLGKYNRTLLAGLNFTIPLIESMPTKINLALQNFLFDFDAVTKDKVQIRLKANLLFAVNAKNVLEYWYGLTDPRQTLGSFVENYVRSFVATQSHEELLERREEISQYLIQHLDEKMIKWGINISAFQVMDIVFPNDITQAMSKVVASQRLKEAAQNEAEANKIRVVKEAEAEKDSRVLLGEGVAGERQAIIDGLRNSIKDMTSIKGLNTNEVMNLIVLSQYFDTIKDIGKSQNSKVIFLNPAPEGANELVQQLTSAIEGTTPVKHN